MNVNEPRDAGTSLTVSRHLVDRTEGMDGTGDWAEFRQPVERIYEAAAEWKRQLRGVEKPWLCWNINNRWCALQQRMILSVGWTPVVGFDPRLVSPSIVSGAIQIDFNHRFQFPVMWPHFPLEFAFLFASRLAFWHSDLVCRCETLAALARRFERLPDGQMAAVLSRGGIRNLLNVRSHRYWELACCTTQSASKDQFQRGAGWWRNFAMHPSCTDPLERERRKRYNYDSGVGIRYWKKQYGGKVIDIPERELNEGHCTAINRKGYRYLAAGAVHRPVGDELEANYSLEDVAARMGVEHFL
jgi:hypothetical protein